MPKATSFYLALWSVPWGVRSHTESENCGFNEWPRRNVIQYPIMDPILKVKKRSISVRSGTLLAVFFAFVRGQDKTNVVFVRQRTRSWLIELTFIEGCRIVFQYCINWGEHVINFILKYLDYCPEPTQEDLGFSSSRWLSISPHPVLSLFVKKQEKGLFHSPMFLFLARKIASFH